MNDLTKLFDNVIEDFRSLHNALDLADKSAIYLGEKKEWSIGDYALILFNVANVGLRGVKTIHDADKFIVALKNPKPAPIQIPARLHFPQRTKTLVHKRRRTFKTRTVPSRALSRPTLQSGIVSEN